MQDVAWHNHNEHIFGSVGDDKQLIIWDTRKQSALLSTLCHPCARALFPAAGTGLLSSNVSCMEVLWATLAARRRLCGGSYVVRLCIKLWLALI